MTPRTTLYRAADGLLHFRHHAEAIGRGDKRVRRRLNLQQIRTRPDICTECVREIVRVRAEER